MPTTNPPPLKVPKSLSIDQESRSFFKELTNSLYQLWFSGTSSNSIDTGGSGSNIDMGDRLDGSATMDCGSRV